MELIKEGCKLMALNMKRGSAAIDVVIFSAVLVFILLPVFSAVMEKYLLNEKCQRIRDAADMANMAVYYSLDIKSLSRVGINFDIQKARAVYEGVLAENLRLDSGLMPEEGSIAEGPVSVDGLEIYTAGLPLRCPNGVIIERSSIHSVVSIPVRPALYRQMLLSALGKEFVRLTVHIDSEIPVNN